MVVASIILGILFIISGIFCISAPVETFLGAAYYLAILLFVYGIFGMIRFFRKKSLVLEFVISIIAVVIGFIYVFRPGGTPAVGNLIGLDRFVLFLLAAWFLIKGVITLIVSIKTRFVNKRWIWGVIVGVLSIILGAYCFAQPVFAAATTGTLIGICFVQCGLDFLALGTTVGIIKGTVKGIQKDVAAAKDEIRSAARKAADEFRANAAAAKAPEAAGETADAIAEDAGKKE